MTIKRIPTPDAMATISGHRGLAITPERLSSMETLLVTVDGMAQSLDELKIADAPMANNFDARWSVSNE